MSDLTEMLLEAAGRVPRKNQQPPSSRRPPSKDSSYSDDDDDSRDDDSDYDRYAATRKPSQVPLKKRLNPTDDEHSSSTSRQDDDDDEHDDDRYGRDGDSDGDSFDSDLYKDENDRKKLAKMSELDREMILADRANKRADKDMKISMKKKNEKSRKDTSSPHTVNRAVHSSARSADRTSALNELRNHKRLRHLDPESRRDYLTEMLLEAAGRVPGKNQQPPSSRRPPSKDSSYSDDDDDDSRVDDYDYDRYVATTKPSQVCTSRTILSSLSGNMPRYDDRHGSTRLYVGHLASRTRSRDLEDIFCRYGRIRDVDMKRDFAFVEYNDPRDADDARYGLNGRDVHGSRIVVEFAKGAPRGGGDRGDRDGGPPGSSRDFLGRGPPPGAGRCFNCGLDGHWARDCKAGDWKNKCYRCGERGHIERNCQNSPKKVTRGRSYSRTPSPLRRACRWSRSLSRSRSNSRSRSPAKRDRSVERAERRSKSPRRNHASPPPSKGRKHSPSSPDDNRSLQEKGTPSPRDHTGRPKATSRSPMEDDAREVSLSIS